MLEARLNEAGILKKLLDSIKELVTDANFECNDEGINLQAMDNSHVALVSVRLHADSFKRYRCDRPLPLGVNLGALTKVLKCAKDDDVCVLKAADEADVLSLTYESKNSDRIAEYDMKLMEIDSDTLGIPDTEYDARVTMPSTELARIVRDLSQLGESVRIEVSKDGVRFVSDGESANGSVLLKHTGRGGGSGSKTKKEESEDEEDVKKEQQDDVEMDEDGEEEKEADEDEDDEEQEKGKKRKKAQAKSSKPAKKSKRTTAEDEGGDEGGVNIEMNQHVNLTFSLKYLVNFSKSTALSKTVMLMMSNDVPLLVSYEFGQGFIRYYLAPKIGDD